MHVCNYQRIFQSLIITSFLTQKHLNYHLKGTTSERSVEVREANDNSAQEIVSCVHASLTCSKVFTIPALMDPVSSVYFNTCFGCAFANVRKMHHEQHQTTYSKTPSYTQSLEGTCKPRSIHPEIKDLLITDFQTMHHTNISSPTIPVVQRFSASN